MPAYPVFGVQLDPYYLCRLVRIYGLSVQFFGHWPIKKAKVKALQGLYLLTKRVAHTTRKAHDKPKIWLKVGARGLEPPNLTDVNRAL